MRGTMIWRLGDLIKSAHTTAQSLRLPGAEQDVWISARPEGFWGLRYSLHAAWLVFTGRADAVIWPADYLMDDADRSALKQGEGS